MLGGDSKPPPGLPIACDTMNASTKRAEPPASPISETEATSPATPSRKRVRLVMVR